MTFLDSFFNRALLAGIGAALAAAPLGCFVIWRRMAFFGDATAHAAILGVALSLAFSLPLLPAVLLVALSMAALITALSGHRQSVDTLLGVLSHSALAIGLVAVSLIPGVRIHPEQFLFGDILAVSREDLIVVFGGTICVLALLAWRWQALLTATLNPDLARASGISEKREQFALTVALAIVVAISLKIVGALLIGALLILPAATARPLAKTPDRMAQLACIFGVVASYAGLQTAYVLDTPAGPTIVCTATLFFVLSQVAALITGRLRS